ncbi:transposase, partial [Escherichia coli]|uniref:transposase n=1 Tax=Escherichia coli TaxID=562 RepID=UPI0011E9B0A1
MQKNVTPGRRKGCPNYPPEFKQQLVAASCEPGISISKLALENGINANLLFKWRQQLGATGKRAITFFREPPATSCDSRCSCRT